MFPVARRLSMYGGDAASSVLIRARDRCNFCASKMMFSLFSYQQAEIRFVPTCHDNNINKAQTVC